MWHFVRGCFWLWHFVPWHFVRTPVSTSHEVDLCSTHCPTAIHVLLGVYSNCGCKYTTFHADDRAFRAFPSANDHCIRLTSYYCHSHTIPSDAEYIWWQNLMNINICYSTRKKHQQITFVRSIMSDNATWCLRPSKNFLPSPLSELVDAQCCRHFRQQNWTCVLKMQLLTCEQIHSNYLIAVILITFTLFLLLHEFVKSYLLGGDVLSEWWVNIMFSISIRHRRESR